VTLNPIITNNSSATTSPQNSLETSCIIKTTSAEISFFNAVDERIIQTILSVTYTVVRKLHKKKRNDSFRVGIEVEEIRHHPTNTQCDCCLGQMTGSKIHSGKNNAHPAY